jgi:activator of HSP90 ATPase
MAYKINTIKKTKDLGYQISVSKVFPLPTHKMWDFLLSDLGIATWLGKISLEDFELQKQFVTDKGVEGKLTVFVPDCHLRFKWKPSNWDKQSTVELRVKNSKGKSSVIFHHTGFYKIELQEELRQYWKEIITKMIDELKIQNA